MTAQDSQHPVPDIPTALSDFHERNDQDLLLQALAVGELVIPQVEPRDPDGGVRLPYVEREGTRYVVAFSSQQRLDTSGFDVPDSVVVAGAALGEMWPVDDELWLAIDPGSEQSVAVPPNAVRALPALAGR